MKVGARAVRRTLGIFKKCSVKIAEVFLSMVSQGDHSGPDLLTGLMGAARLFCNTYPGPTCG